MNFLNIPFPIVIYYAAANLSTHHNYKMQVSNSNAASNCSISRF